MRALLLLLVLVGMSEVGWGQCYNNDTSWCMPDTFVKVGKRHVNLKKYKEQYGDSVPNEIFKECFYCHDPKGFRMNGLSSSIYRSRGVLSNPLRENQTQINFGGMNIGVEFGNNFTIGFGLQFELDWLLWQDYSPINDFITDLNHEAFHRGLGGFDFYLGYKIKLHRKLEFEIRSKYTSWFLSPAYKDLIGHDIPMVGVEVFLKRMNRFHEFGYYSYDISFSWNKLTLSKFENSLNSSYVRNYSMFELKIAISLHLRNQAVSHFKPFI